MPNDPTLLVLFMLLGSIFGLGSAFLLFRFDGSWLKAISFAGGAAILTGEFVVLQHFFNITETERPTVFVCFLLAWIISFVSAFLIMLRILKKQESRYKIETWEILFGDKKAIDDYYSLKREEIRGLLEQELDIEHLTRLKAEIDNECDALANETRHLEALQDGVESIFDKKQCIVIPISHKYPVTARYFELLPGYVRAVSDFVHHLTAFTDDFVGKLPATDTNPEYSQLKSYLLGVSYYIGQMLFSWRDVRVHFRCLNRRTGCYEKFVAVHRSGEEYCEEITPIPEREGLISEAFRVKRSLVRSANRSVCFDTGSGHLWKDYITMVFDRITLDGRPVLSLGVSVRHDADHRDLLYFLSFIQVEQILQDNLLEIERHLSIANAIQKGAGEGDVYSGF